MPTRITPKENPLTTLAARKKPTAEEIKELIDGMKQALRAAGPSGLDFYARMEQNHDAREAYWHGQTTDGRKWSKALDSRRLRRSLPGELRNEVYPFEGASDARVRLIDMVIKERVHFMRLALDRRQEQMGPRNLSPDDDAQAKSSLWAQVLSYFEDMTRNRFRKSCARWADVREEYGHGILYTGWHRDQELVPMEISVKEVIAVMAQTAVQMAEDQMKAAHEEQGGDPDAAPTLTREEMQLITQDAAARVEDMRDDPKQIKIFIGALMKLDERMPATEATRLAKELRFGETAEYYSIDPKDDYPEWVALTPFVDVFYPATVKSLDKAPWICMTEWVTKAELRSRIDTDGYDKDWVDEVLQTQTGRAFDLSELGISDHSWLLSSGSVRCGIKSMDILDSQADAFQILHVFYRSTALGNVRAMYRTILHGAISDKFATHECCPYAHGSYPFFASTAQAEVAYLAAAKGAGELSDTLQDTAKTTVDEIRDSASMRADPPMLVPHTQTGNVDWYPGARIRSRNHQQTQGLYQPLPTGSDATGSVSMHALNMDLFNEFWARGPKVDPEVKMAARQLMISDFLEDVREARMMTFQLIQEFAPDELRAAFVQGVQVDLQATRQEIQGLLWMRLDFDVLDLNTESRKEFMESLEILTRLDPKRLLNTEPLLRAVTARLLPAYRHTLVENSEKRSKQESEDEKRIINEIMTGTQTPEDELASYYPGDHAARKKLIDRIFGLQTDAKGNILQVLPQGTDGQPTKAQRTLSEDPDVQKRVLNRLRYHARQLKQEENAITGARQVETVTQEAEAA
jgi:hypothetical protein